MRLRKKVPLETAPAPAPAPATEAVTAPADLAVRPDGTRLGERLVTAGLVTSEQVVSALGRARDGAAVRLGQLLVDAGAVSERDVAGIVAV